MLSDWRVWALTLPDFCFAFGLYGLGLWLPQMVKGLGHDNAQTGWIVMIPYGDFGSDDVGLRLVQRPQR